MLKDLKFGVSGLGSKVLTQEGVGVAKHPHQAISGKSIYEVNTVELL